MRVASRIIPVFFCQIECVIRAEKTLANEFNSSSNAAFTHAIFFNKNIFELSSCLLRNDSYIWLMALRCQKLCEMTHNIIILHIRIAKNSMYYINHKCDGFFSLSPFLYRLLSQRRCFFTKSYIVLFTNGICTQQHQQSTKKSFFTHSQHILCMYLCISILSESMAYRWKEIDKHLPTQKQNHFINMLSEIVHSVISNPTHDKKNRTHHT